MIYKRGFLARPLDALFANATRVGVLRVLAEGGELRSGRAIARLAGANHQAVANALEALRALGVVQRSGTGRTTSWTLSPRGILSAGIVQSIFSTERGFAKQAVDFLRAELRADCDGVILYGAVAKGRLEAGGMLKFAAVVGKSGRLRLNAKLRALEAQLRHRWSLRAEGKSVSSSEAGTLALFEEAWRILPDEGRGWPG